MRTAAAWILAVFLSSGFAAVAGAQMTYDANYDSKIELKPTEAGSRTASRNSPSESSPTR
jgi:glutamate mutase epsilon subunit